MILHVYWPSKKAWQAGEGKHEEVIGTPHIRMNKHDLVYWYPTVAGTQFGASVEIEVFDDIPQPQEPTTNVVMSPDYHWYHGPMV